MQLRRYFLPGVGLFLTGLSLLHAAPAARIAEERVVLPTYRVAPPDPSPRFYSGRTYQGAKATYYPYPVYDELTDRKEDVSYKAFILENDYIKISVLPELGGRIFTAEDKGNRYDFFYRQHVIKPALIGMLGAWISGGVEWNVPHHHRASSFLPVDYKVEAGLDGSKTLWVGETELRHRLRWMVGLTIHPDRSYVEMTVKIINRTPAAQSVLFWINPAVHANENYQVIFPPSVQYAVQHAKPEFASWPVARQVYGGTDYTRGVDISWWKNHPNPVSFFAWHCEEDFFGGYDHGKQAGVVQVSNHHLSPGKKFFEWGNGSEGETWSRILTDQDGPYLELMAGSYSDNQPDYSWCQPYETKVFTHYWYPVRNLGGLKNANTEAALNLEVSNRVVRVAINTTRPHTQARATLVAGDAVLLDQTLDINPAEPFATTCTLAEGLCEGALHLTLRDAKGQELISYRPVRATNSPMPTPVKKPAPPQEITNHEELYLTGLRVEQLFSPAYDPVSYYSEALRRDPGDYRANTALGQLYCRQGCFREAEPLLRAAVARATQNYIRPKDNEAQYYLGVALRAQGRLDEAWQALYGAVWGQAWKGPSYYALAEIASCRGRHQQALELVEQSLLVNALNLKALELRISLLRRLGQLETAETEARALLKLDPLSFRAWYELDLTRVALGAQARATRTFLRFKDLIRGEVSSYLELAVDYGNAGLHDEAIRVLTRYLEGVEPPSESHPMAHYFLGYYHDLKGQGEEALRQYRLAAQRPVNLCFPFQYEAGLALRQAMQRNSTDACAACYLGNLLYDARPLKALELWERAVRLDPSLALAHRNLALAKSQAQHDLPGAVAELEKALTLESTNARWYYELDTLYEAGGTPVARRLESLSRQPEVVLARDDTATRRVMVLTVAGRQDEAMELLAKRHFHTWEGSREIHDVYVSACLARGVQRLNSKQYAGALRDFGAALEYPANHDVGRSRRADREAEIQYWTGLAHQAVNQPDLATNAWTKAAQRGRGERVSEAGFYRAMAQAALGQTEEARQSFAALLQQGREDLERKTEAVDYFAKFGEKRAERLRQAQGHYLIALAYLGQDKLAEARTELQQTLTLHPAHLGALTWAARVRENTAP